MTSKKIDTSFTDPVPGNIKMFSVDWEILPDVAEAMQKDADKRGLTMWELISGIVEGTIKR